MNLNYLIIVLLFLVSTNSWALSSLKCTSNQAISYSSENHVGGVHPFPGMVTNVEEIMQGGVVTYRLVTRESCVGRPDCEIQNPELIDILPAGFSFYFDESSKIVLDVNGPDHDAIFLETYALKFHLVSDVWMICDYSRMLVP